MAARRAGGSGGLLVTLVVFVILFVFAAVLAVVFYTRWQGAEVERGNIETQLNRWATSQDQARPELAPRLANAREGSVVAQLQSELDRLKQMVAGAGAREASLAAVQSDAQQAGVNVEQGETLLAAIRRLRLEQEDLRGQLAQQRTLLEAAEMRATDAERQREEVARAFATATQGLNAQIQQLQQQVQAYDAAAGEQRGTLAQQLEEVRRQTAEQVQAANQEVERWKGVAADLQRRVDELTPTRGEPGVPVKAHLQPDGRIISILTDENMVYIDRGRANRVVAGLTFELFDQSSGITENEFGELRGKATIEVVNVGDTTSVARIVRGGRRAIREGDLVANLVYDPNQIFRFMVFGEFDIDNVGQATVADRRRIETMIREWGGEVAERMSYDTDFLVLGREPALPDPLPDEVVDPVRIAEHAQQMQRYEQYQQLLEQARELGVPVLNQNRFLQLVGHYQR